MPASDISSRINSYTTAVAADGGAPPLPRVLQDTQTATQISTAPTTAVAPAVQEPALEATTQPAPATTAAAEGSLDHDITDSLQAQPPAAELALPSTMDLSATPPELRPSAASNALSPSETFASDHGSRPGSAVSSLTEFDFAQLQKTQPPQEPAAADPLPEEDRATRRSLEPTVADVARAVPVLSHVAGTSASKQFGPTPSATRSADIFAGQQTLNSQTLGSVTPLSRPLAPFVASDKSTALTAQSDAGTYSPTPPATTLPSSSTLPTPSHAYPESLHRGSAPPQDATTHNYNDGAPNSIVRTATPFTKASDCKKTPSPQTPLPLIDGHAVTTSSPLPSAPSTSAGVKNVYLDIMVFEEQQLQQQQHEQQQQLLQLEEQKLLLRRQQQQYQQQYQLLQQQHNFVGGGSPEHTRPASSIDMDSDEYENILHDDDASSTDSEDDLDQHGRGAGSSRSTQYHDAFPPNKRATMTRQTVLDEFENDIRDLLLLNSASPFTDLKLNFIEKEGDEPAQATANTRQGSAAHETGIPNTLNINTPTAQDFDEQPLDLNNTSNTAPGFAHAANENDNDAFIFSQEPRVEKEVTPEVPSQLMATATSSPEPKLAAPSAPAVPATRQFDNSAQIEDQHSITSDASTNMYDVASAPTSAAPPSSNVQSATTSGGSSSGNAHVPQHRKTTSQRFSSSSKTLPMLQQYSPKSSGTSSPEEPQKDSRFFHRKNGSTKSTSFTFAWLMDDKHHDKHLSMVTSKDEKRPSLVHKTSNMSLSSKLRASSAFRLSSIVSSSSENNPNVITNLNYHQHLSQPSTATATQSSVKRPASANFIYVPPSLPKPQFEALQKNGKIVSLWFLKQVVLSHSQDVGIFLTPHLFLPANIWRVLNVTPKLLDSRVECIRAATKMGESFLESAQIINDAAYDGEDTMEQKRQKQMWQAVEELRSQQGSQLATLEQKFHIAFIEPLSATPATPPPTQQADLHLVQSAVNRLSIMTQGHESSSMSSIKSPTAVASNVASRKSSTSGAVTGRKSLNSSFPVSIGEPLSSTTSVTSTIADSVPTSRPESQDWDASSMSAHDNSAYAGSTTLSEAGTVGVNYSKSHGGAHPGEVTSESSIAVYLTALSGLIHVLESLHHLGHEDANGATAAALQSKSTEAIRAWVAGYRRFISKCVCRLILKDVLYLIDVYQTQIRDWILS